MTANLDCYRMEAVPNLNLKTLNPKSLKRKALTGTS